MTMGLIGLVINAGLLLATAYVANSTGFDLTVGDFPPDRSRPTRSSPPSSVRSVLSLVGTAVRLVVRD